MIAIEPMIMHFERRVLPSRGVTLIELMVAVAVLAILALVAVPAYNEVVLGSRLTSLANSFVSSLSLARSEAIKRNALVTVCKSADGASCTNDGGWQQGWIVLAGTTVVQYQQALPTGLSLTGDAGVANSVVYHPSGMLNSASGILTLCRATPTVATTQRKISLTQTGRPTVTKTTGTTCP